MQPSKKKSSTASALQIIGLLVVLMAFAILFFFEGDGSMDEAIGIGGMFFLLLIVGIFLISAGFVARRMPDKSQARTSKALPIIRLLIIFVGLFNFIWETGHRGGWAIWSLYALALTFIPNIQRRFGNSDSSVLKNKSRFMAFLTAAVLTAVAIYLSSLVRGNAP